MFKSVELNMSWCRSWSGGNCGGGSGFVEER